MALQTAALNEGADGVAGAAAFASLHTANPDPAGGSEVVGGGYARQAITWDPATGGIAALNGVLAFSGPAGGAATHLGIWSLASGGTYYGSAALTGDQTFNAAGEYNVTAANITATAA